MNYAKYPLFEGMTKSQALKYMDRLEAHKYEWIPCTCTNLSPKGRCPGWEAGFEQGEKEINFSL
jgi:hypothetical protein